MDSSISMTNSPLRWHLVLTKPRGEQTAKTHLERQGYRVYFPRVQQKLMKRGAWRETISALFPRYLFVQLNATIQSLGPMRSTLGVASVVRFGTEFITVPESIVDGLIAREDQTGVHRMSLAPLYQPGAAIRVLEGAFAGLEGMFEREAANDRVLILLNMLGSETRLKVPAASIAPAESSY